MSLFPDELPAKFTSSDWIHAHCDGGSRGNPGPSGFGAVITDSKGQILAQLSDFLGTRTNNYAEYSGLLAVLDYALQNGHSRLKVVSDSLLMVSQIQGKYKVNSADLKPLWQEARNRIGRLEAFEIAHALRHKNKEADALANQAMDRGTSKIAAKVSAPSPPAQSETMGPRPKHGPWPDAGKETPTQSSSTMHRGFTRGGTIHLLGGATLPDGIFVKIIPE